MKLLLNYSKRFYNRQFITRKRFNKDTVALFSDLLEEYFSNGMQKQMGIPSVQYFAEKLNFSSNYLSDLIRKGTDKSILEHIHYYVIELAKNKVGKTPLQYRNLN